MGGGMGVGVKGGWRVNAFLFLLTASQGVLLPWTPLILQSAGLRGTAVGGIVAAITLASSAGVGVSLTGLRRTRNGALRRLMMVMLLTVSTILHVASVLVLPIAPGGNYPPCGGLSEELSLSYNASLSPSATQVGQGMAPPTDNGTPNSTIINAVVYQPLQNMKTTPKPKPTSTNITVPGIDILQTTKPLTTAPNLDVVSHAQSSVQINITEPDSKPSSESSNASSNTDYPLSNVSTGQNISVQNDSSNSPTSETPEMDPPAPPNSSEDEDVLETTEKNEEVPMTDVLPTTATNTNFSDRVKNPGQQGGKPSSGQDNKNSGKGKHNGYKNKDGKHNTKELENEYESAFDDYPSDNGDFYYYYDTDSLGSHRKPQHSPIAPEDTWKSISSLQSSNSQRNYAGTHRNAHGYHTDKQTWPKDDGDSQRDSSNIHSLQPALRPPPPPPYTHKHSHSSSAHGDHAFKPYSPAIHNQKAYPQKFDDSAPKNRGSGLDWLNKRISDYKRMQHQRQKRSANMRKNPEVAAIIDPQDRIRGEAENNSEISSWTGIDIQDFSSVGLEVGVSFLLIFGALLGSGVEAAVAQLWHCYAHGYDEGGVSQDILQRTITHTFHMSVYGTHNLWAKLTSGAWVLGAGVVSIVLCAMGLGMGTFGGLAGMHLVLGVCAAMMLLVIPVPYGSVDPPKTKRPLSLYLDDEVLREGLRRMSFHMWVFATGSLCSLSLVFGIWLVQEMVGSQGSGLAAQAGAVAVTLVSEGLSLHVQRWLVSRVGLQGVMGVSGIALLAHFATMWASGGVGGVVVAHAGLGCCMAFIWVSVKHNALLLATVGDQEQEAWASWWCWRVGVALGAAVWGLSVEGAGGTVRPLLMVATLLASIVAIVVGTVALFTRRQWRTRRRVYHTLDLDLADSPDDDEEDDAAEDDWLVKRAKKEGISL